MRPKKSSVRVVIFCNQAKNGDLGMLYSDSVLQAHQRQHWSVLLSSPHVVPRHGNYLTQCFFSTFFLYLGSRDSICRAVEVFPSSTHSLSLIISSSLLLNSVAIPPSGVDMSFQPILIPEEHGSFKGFQEVILV